MAKFISCQLKTKSSRVLLAFWIVFCAAQAGKAERLPLNFYTSADGMASSVVNHVFRDSRGFLWFSTREGLARFDGRDFVNYRLPTANDSRNVSFVLERRGGTYLIGGGDGLYRIARRDETFVQPEPERGQKQDADLFLGAEKVSESNFRLLYEDKSGRVWGGSDSGLYLLQESERKIVAHSIELPAAALTDRKIVGVTSIAEGADGSLWVGGQTGLVRRLPDGKMLHYPVERASDYDSVLSIATARAGRIFVGHSGGLFVFQPEPLESLQNVPQFESRRPPISQESLESSGEISLPDESGAMLHIILRRAGNQANDSEYTQVSKVFAASDDRIWATANGVLYVFENNTVHALNDERGLPIYFLGIAEDGGGNLWFGSSSGAIRLTKQGFTNFGRGDGLFPLNIQSLYQTEDNKVYAVFGDWRVAEIAGDNLKTAHLKMPGSARAIWGSTVAMPDGETGG